MIDIVKRHGGVLATYAAIGTAVYWTALGAFFLSDDFEFIDAVVSTPSWLPVHPDAARFFRPLVVLTYAVCYRLFGLDPVPYHLVVVLLHIFNAWCVYLIARRLLPDARYAPELTGILFLVFSSHSEAVAWPAGVADPALAALLLPAFLAYLRALDPGASRGWIVASVLLMLGGILAKESWVVFPALVLTHALVVARPGRREWRRVGALLAAAAAGVGLYLLARRMAFGSVAGAYAGLGSSIESGAFFDTTRVFVLRCVIPGGLRALDIWVRRVDLLIWPIALGALALLGRKREARVAAFGAAATLIALAPTLPLTISIVNTESERFTYLPTVFSCLFVVSAAAAILRRPALVIVGCAPLVLWHAVVLGRNTTRLRDAGEMSRGIAESFAAAVRQHDPDGSRAIFVLNLPDSLAGAYVYRRGFYPAVRLMAPDVVASTARTTGIATNTFGSLHDRVEVRRTAPNRFVLDLRGSPIVQPSIPSSVWYRIVSQAPASYEVEFAETIATAVVLFTNGMHVEHAGNVASRGIPFGTLEIPAEGSVCQGEAIRFSGWALDDRGVSSVLVEAMTDDGASVPIGRGTWASGTRPDVAAKFGWLPASGRAEWNYLLPCATVAAARDGALRVRVTAVDSDGQHAPLGSRVVRAAR